MATVVLGAMFLIGMLFSAGGPVGSGGAGVTGGYTSYSPDLARVAGDSPVATAILLSRVWSKTPEVVITAEDDVISSAIAGPLAAQLDAPLLVVRKGQNAEVLQRIQELGVTHALFVGTVTAGLDPYGLEIGDVKVTMLGSSDPIATSAAVATHMGAGGALKEVVVLPRADAALALGVAPLASAAHAPILIAKSGTTLNVDSKALGSPSLSEITMVSAETSEVLVAGISGPRTLLVHLSQKDPVASSAEVADRAFARGFSYATVFAVTSDNAAYAAAVGPLVAHADESTASAYLSPLIITGTDGIEPGAEDFFVRHASSIKNVRFLGPQGSQGRRVEDVVAAAAETRISEDARVVDQATVEGIESYDASSGVLVMKGGTAADYEPGTVLVSQRYSGRGMPFVRVVSAEEKDGKLVVQTDRASLEDVVVKGSLDVRVSSAAAPETVTKAPGTGALMPVSNRGSGTGTGPELVPVTKPGTYGIGSGAALQLIPQMEKTLSLKNASGQTITATTNDSMWVSVDYVLQATWVPDPKKPKKGKLDRIDVYVQVINDLDIKWDLAGDAIQVGKTESLPGVPIGALAGSVGPIPVWGDLEVNPVYAAEFSIGSKVSFTYSLFTSAIIGQKGKRQPNGEFVFTDISSVTAPSTEWDVFFRTVGEGRVGLGVQLSANLYPCPVLEDPGAEMYLRALTFLRGAFESDAFHVSSKPGASGMKSDGKAELGWGVMPSVGGEFALWGVFDEAGVDFHPTYEQLEKIGLYRIIKRWPEAAPGTQPGVLYYFDGAAGIPGSLVHADSGKRVKAFKDFGLGWNIGVPSPNGQCMALILRRPHNGDFLGFSVLDMKHDRVIEVPDSTTQVDWYGWSADSQRAFYGLYSDGSKNCVDVSAWATRRMAPTNVATQHVPDWDLSVSESALGKKLIAGARGSGHLSGGSSVTQILTVQVEPITKRLAFSTEHLADSNALRGTEVWTYDVWTADANGEGVKWIGAGYGPIWDARY